MIQLNLIGNGNHANLVNRAKIWLNKRCDYVITEMGGYNIYEEADAIGWKGGFSTLIECKSTRSDFLQDKGKPFRQNPLEGMGNHRYFMTPPNLVSPEELPDGWGLLYAYPKVTRMKKSPATSFSANKKQEQVLLANALRNYRAGYWNSLPVEVSDLLQRIVDYAEDDWNKHLVSEIKRMIAKLPA